MLKEREHLLQITRKLSEAGLLDVKHQGRHRYYRLAGENVAHWLETFALGFPIHFDWSWRTLFNRNWEDYVYSYQAAPDGDSSGRRWPRRPKFSVWIGYDF